MTAIRNRKPVTLTNKEMLTIISLRRKNSIRKSSAIQDKINHRN